MKKKHNVIKVTKIILILHIRELTSEQKNIITGMDKQTCF